MLLVRDGLIVYFVLQRGRGTRQTYLDSVTSSSGSQAQETKRKDHRTTRLTIRLNPKYTEPEEEENRKAPKSELQFHDQIAS
jgi:hypothetical protein